MDIKLSVRKLISKIVPKISWITWNGPKSLINNGIFFDLLDEDWDQIQKTLSKNHYIILTRNSTHFSNYLVSLGTKIATGKWGFYGHALMNLENTTTPEPDDYRLIEATSTGVHYSTFFDVFTCDAVCILKPKGLTHKKWLSILDKAKTELGKPYDNLLDLVNDQEINCVELVRTTLKTLPDYNKKFANLEKMISENDGNLVPDMFYNCPDFEIVFEARR